MQVASSDIVRHFYIICIYNRPSEIIIMNITISYNNNSDGNEFIPEWLTQQTQKQRIIWGYKILFLDVLFPLSVKKVIYVDADQVIRADLKELWDHDLQGTCCLYIVATYLYFMFIHTCISTIHSILAYYIHDGFTTYLH